MARTGKGEAVLRLAFKVFHDVQEPVIDIWLLMELHLYLVEVT